MTLLASSRVDKFGLMAILLVAFIVPIYAIASFEGTVVVSPSRWLAFHIMIAEAVVVVLAILSGWNPCRSWKTLPSHVRRAITLWLVVASTATAFSSDIVLSAFFQMFWLAHGIFSWALWSMLTNQWRGLQFPLLVHFSLGLLLYSLGIYFVAWVILGPSLDEWERYSFGVTNPRQYIFYADALLGIGLGLLIAARKRAVWLLAVILVLAAYHLFAWSGGRASFGLSLIMPPSLPFWLASNGSG